MTLALAAVRLEWGARLSALGAALHGSAAAVYLAARFVAVGAVATDVTGSSR